MVCGEGEVRVLVRELGALLLAFVPSTLVLLRPGLFRRPFTLLVGGDMAF